MFSTTHTSIVSLLRPQLKRKQRDHLSFKPDCLTRWLTTERMQAFPSEKLCLTILPSFPSQASSQKSWRMFTGTCSTGLTPPEPL